MAPECSPYGVSNTFLRYTCVFLALICLRFGQLDAQEAPRELFPYGFGGLDNLPVSDVVDLVMDLGYSGIVPEVSARTQDDLDRLESYLDRADLEGDAFNVYAVYLNHKVFNLGYDRSFHETIIDMLAARGGGTLWIAVRAVRRPDTEITDYEAVNNFIAGIFNYATGFDENDEYRNVNIVLYPHINNAYESAVAAMSLVDEIDDPRFTVCINLIHEFHAGRSDTISLTDTFEQVRGHIGAVILGGIQTDGGFSILSLEDSELDLSPFVSLIEESEYTAPVAFINFGIPGDTSDPYDYVETYLTGSINEWVSLASAAELYVAPEFEFKASIKPSAEGVDFQWTSRMNKFYDIISTTDLSVPQSEWEVFGDGETVYSDLHTSGVGVNSLENIEVSGQQRFFSIREKNRPDA